jgi:hypothetical protein
MRRPLLCCVVLAFLSALVPACSGKARQVAESATAEFRVRCARSAFDEIYAASAPDLWTSATKDDFLKLMNGVKRKLGLWRSSTSLGWRTMAGTGGRTVNLGFQSAFEKGAATEELVWRVEDDQAALVGYHINSQAFFAELGRACRRTSRCSGRSPARAAPRWADSARARATPAPPRGHATLGASVWRSSLNGRSLAGRNQRSGGLSETRQCGCWLLLLGASASWLAGRRGPHARLSRMQVWLSARPLRPRAVARRGRRGSFGVPSSRSTSSRNSTSFLRNIDHARSRASAFWRTLIVRLAAITSLSHRRLREKLRPSATGSSPYSNQRNAGACTSASLPNVPSAWRDAVSRRSRTRRSLAPANRPLQRTGLAPRR